MREPVVQHKMPCLPPIQSNQHRLTKRHHDDQTARSDSTYGHRPTVSYRAPPQFTYSPALSFRSSLQPQRFWQDRRPRHRRQRQQSRRRRLVLRSHNLHIPNVIQSTKDIRQPYRLWILTQGDGVASPGTHCAPHTRGAE